MKKLALTICLLLCAALLSGCMLIPISQLTGMLPAEGSRDGNETEATPVPDDENDVMISRELYERYRKFDTMLEMMDAVNALYYQDVDEEKMLQGAAAGLLDAIDDPYTFYYTPEDYAKLWEDDEGEYVGIGIMISGNYNTQICTVTRVFEGGPAAGAGVKKGDILYRVGDDLYVTADTLDEAVSIMRGVPGTDVTVTFIRNGEEYSATMTRAAVTVNRVESTMLDNQIGYIYLYEFAGSCADDFAAHLERLVEGGAQGIMIDLRDNGGGWVQDARRIADLFLDQGTLCYLENKAGEREYYYTSTDGKEVKLPIVILVNENTASSSEILTGALKDRANATVVGTLSFGKGIVQVVIPVGSEGAGMQVTEAQYFTPNGNAVHKIGITPDVVIERPEGSETMFELGDMADVQLKTAYDTMLSLINR